ncbi:MAG: beta-galactosidase [Clostridia bacterium]|nr:beta-galactosidase [Clostridia bacterium]
MAEKSASGAVQTMKFGKGTFPAPIGNHLRMGDTSPSGERLYANSLYFTRNGKPFIGVMGEYHFSRDRKENWYEELCKMKAGGISVVSTYLFWICHEEAEGEFDFSGDLDVRSFVLAAQKAGLRVWVRIGPWAHGECRNGGFPDWLLEKKIPLRCDDARYLAYARRWYEKIYEQLRGLFFREGGNIVGIQFDNELVNDAVHLMTLKRMALDIGFRAPYYSVTGWNSAYGAKIPVDEVLPVFGGYMSAPWAKGTEELPLSHHYVFDPNRNDSGVGVDVLKHLPPDGWLLPYERYPFVTCELGAGLHSTHHRRFIVTPMDAYALSLVKLGSGNNLIGYYMYHGGENKIGKYSTLNETRASGYPNDYPILNYDYQTALSQYGQSNGQYGLLNMLHLFAQDFGDRLAPMRYVPSEEAGDENDLKSLRYCLRTDGESGFVFVNHHQRRAKLEDVKGVCFVTPEGVRFPKIDVCGENCFFLSYRFDLGGNLLLSATAQPLCRDGDTFFFAQIEGIPPRYVFEDAELFAQAGRENSLRYKNIRIVTLKSEEAVHLRRLGKSLYLGDGCDVYESGGEIRCIRPGSFRYWIWDGEGFSPRKKNIPFENARLTAEDCAPCFEPKYIRELTLGADVPVHWKRLRVSGDRGFVSIDLPCDAAQIYADGQLVADEYYVGLPWTLPARLLYGRECFLIYTDMREDVSYDERGPFRFAGD